MARVQKRLCTDRRGYIFVDVSVYPYVTLRMYVCMHCKYFSYVCLYLSLYIYMYIYIYIHIIHKHAHIACIYLHTHMRIQITLYMHVHTRDYTRIGIHIYFM